MIGYIYLVLASFASYKFPESFLDSCGALRASILESIFLRSIIFWDILLRNNLESIPRGFQVSLWFLNIQEYLLLNQQTKTP